MLSDVLVIDLLLEWDIFVKVESQEILVLIGLLLSLLLFVLLIGVWIYFMNWMQGGGCGGVMGFGKFKVKLLIEKYGCVIFDDVVGIDEVKEELEEIVEFLCNL